MKPLILPEENLHAMSLTPLADIAEIHPGDDLGAILAASVTRLGVALQRHDVLVIAQKIVSKAENRYVDLGTVHVSARAAELAAVTGKDPRLVELILGESTTVLRAKTNVLVVRHRLGFVMANAGIDRSNIMASDQRALLLPRDPDGSAAALRASLTARLGVEPGVIISDSFGRAWRKGVTNIALGSAGIPSLIDRRGEIDRGGRKLEVTEVAFADCLATAAGLVMGEGAEGRPAILVRGLSWNAPSNPASALIRPLEEDMFQ
jgi:coenzyme F420-0:L-glutamate ligase/coenzyme F420-1:gamma-L-glutamate ligase